VSTMEEAKSGAGQAYVCGRPTGALSLLELCFFSELGIQWEIAGPAIGSMVPADTVSLSLDAEFPADPPSKNNEIANRGPLPSQLVEVERPRSENAALAADAPACSETANPGAQKPLHDQSPSQDADLTDGNKNDSACSEIANLGAGILPRSRVSFYDADVTDFAGHYRKVKSKKIKKSAQGTTVEVAADKLAQVIMAFVAGGFGVPELAGVFGGFEGQLQMSLSNETDSEVIQEYETSESMNCLIVVKLEKTQKHIAGSCILCESAAYSMMIDGIVTYVEAEDTRTFQKMQQIVNVRGTQELDRLLADLMTSS